MPTSQEKNGWTFEPLAIDMLTFKRFTSMPTPGDRGMAVLLPLFRKARENTKIGSVVEVGSWAGANAIHLADDYFTVYCVDPWTGNPSDITGVIAGVIGGPRTVFQTFCRNVGDRLHNSIIPCVGHSRTWAEIWEKKIAGVFIDANHDYEAVKEDIELWWELIPEGGVLAGHDYITFPGVKQAVDEWLGETCDTDSCEHGVQTETWWRWKCPFPED